MKLNTNCQLEVGADSERLAFSSGITRRSEIRFASELFLNIWCSSPLKLVAVNDTSKHQKTTLEWDFVFKTEYLDGYTDRNVGH